MDTGHSKHRKPRVLRFIHRHPHAHRQLIRELAEAQRAHEARCDRRFHAHQLAAARAKPGPGARKGLGNRIDPGLVESIRKRSAASRRFLPSQLERGAK